MPSVTFKFTSASIHKHLTSTPNSTILRDETLSGLIIRRTGDGSPRFAVEKRLDGRLFKSVLWPLAENARIEDARAKASEIFLSLRDGEDPRRKAKVDSATARTVDDWLDLHKPTTRLSTHGQNVSAIKMMKVGKKRLLVDFQPTDGFDILDALRKAGVADSTARRYLSVLRGLFNFACERLDLETRNPFDKCLKGVRAALPRQQYVSLKDIPKLINAVRLRAGVGGDAVEVLTLTGLRLNEVLQMEWSEVDTTECILTIPAHRMKAGIPLIRPLPKRVMQIISARPKTSNYVFNSDQNSNTPTKSSPRTVLNWAGKTVGIAALRPHDLRRSFITACYEIGMQSTVTRTLVAHSAGGGGAHAGYIMRNDEQLRIAAQQIEDGMLQGLSENTEQDG